MFSKLPCMVTVFNAEGLLLFQSQSSMDCMGDLASQQLRQERAVRLDGSRVPCPAAGPSGALQPLFALEPDRYQEMSQAIAAGKVGRCRTCCSACGRCWAVGLWAEGRHA
jgi:hypothetical protein